MRTVKAQVAQVQVQPALATVNIQAEPHPLDGLEDTSHGTVQVGYKDEQVGLQPPLLLFDKMQMQMKAVAELRLLYSPYLPMTIFVA